MQHELAQAIKMKSLIEKRNNLRNYKWYRNQQRNTDSTVTHAIALFTLAHLNYNDAH